MFKNTMIIAFGLLFTTTAFGAKIESIHVPDDVQSHVNLVTQNCDVVTHLTDRIAEDQFLGNSTYVVDPLRNVDRVMRSCAEGFDTSMRIWRNFHDDYFVQLNVRGSAPVYTRFESQAQHFVGDRFFWVKR